MKKIVFISIWVGLLSMINVGKALSETNIDPKKVTRVSIVLEHKREIQPDILSLRINVKIKANKETDAINILGDADKRIRKLGLNYKGGDYRIEQNCWWAKKGQVCEGVNGYITYNFELRDYKEQNVLYETLNKIKETYPSLTFEVSEPVWIASQELTDKVQKEIKLELVEKAQDFGEALTEKLGKVCRVTSISFTVWRYLPITYRFTMLKSAEPSSIEAPEPMKDEKTVEVSANVDYLCE